MTDKNIYDALMRTLEEQCDEVEKLKARCKSLEEQLLKAQSSAIVYKDLFNEAKRFIGEDTLYRFIYENIDE